MTFYYHNLGIHFDRIAKSYPSRPAILYEERIICYSELNELVAKICQLLLQKGCKKGDVIAVGHTKRPLSFALMLAALRLGVAYVCIDVDSPLNRLKLILDVCSTQWIFYEDIHLSEKMLKLSKKCDLNSFLLSEGTLPKVSKPQIKNHDQIAQNVDGSSIAYIMFTSGSTGTPKGVAITHQNICHFIGWAQKCFEIKNTDNFANLSPMYFDNSVFDFYMSFFSGSSITPISKELLTKPYELIPYLDEMKCTIWFSVPSLLIYVMTMKAMPKYGFKTIRTIIFGGEGYPKVELKKLYDIVSKKTNLVNVYGPTECTCICSAHFITQEDFNDMFGIPMLGRLNQNFDYRILDEDGKDNDQGELCLIGPNVGAGYYNDLERTASSFVVLKDQNRFMKRMYLTGDIVSEEDGKLNYIGRKDFQIKHMGYRIELEEIESAIINIPNINQVAVIYKKGHSAYGKIYAFMASDSKIDEENVKSHLKNNIPDYMIPSKLYVMNTLPKNANGKVDRESLRLLIND